MIKLTVNYNKEIVVGAALSPVINEEYYVNNDLEVLDILSDIIDSETFINDIKFEYNVTPPDDYTTDNE